ncbi:phage tail length tape measure family protein [Roseovarius sp. SYSU LYC5161]|uniref:phage tail length tape measure family protein n=1 Tax=Roseovarius halophilus (ex Wu et al. 2025) TaxID=3376060 RepID=UPI00399BFCFB
MTETVNILRAILDAEDGSGPAVRSFKNNVRGAERSADRFSTFLKTAGHRANRQYAVGLQQVGFQVGDFFTQVASGQNPLRAFIQQGTQVAGAFGPWGAVIGAAGAVVGALAISLWDGESASRDFEEAFDDWVSKLDNLDGAIGAALAPLDQLKEKYGEVDDAVREALEAQAQFAAFEARKGFRDTIGSLTDSDTFRDFTRTPSTFEKYVPLSQLFTDSDEAPLRLVELRENLDLTDEEFKRVAETIRDLDAAALTETLADDKMALEEATEVLAELVDLSEDGLDKGFRKLANNISQALLQMRVMERMRKEAESGGLDLGGGAPLQGGAGDSIEGGQGADILIGGAGSDIVARNARRYRQMRPNLPLGGTSQGAPTQDDVQNAQQLGSALEDVVRQLTRSAASARTLDDAFDAIVNKAGEIIGTGLFGQGQLGPFFNALFGVPRAGLAGLLINADGNAFSQGRVTPFARGGVVNAPTTFPMPNGIGLMGEAGPEAIVPLSRGRDGKLGVRSEGGGSVTVNMNITAADAESFRRSRAQIASEAARALSRAREY